MSDQSPIWRDTYATVADALDLDESTVKRFVREGRYPAVKFPPDAKRPTVRLMPPDEYLRLQGKWSGPHSDPAE